VSQGQQEINEDSAKGHNGLNDEEILKLSKALETTINLEAQFK